MTTIMMTTMMMTMTMTIQRGPTVFTLFGIFLAMQSLVKERPKKIDRNQIKPAGTKKGGIFLKNVQVGKGFVVPLKVDTCNRTDSCKSFSSPEPTILLACGWDRELWFGPTPEVRDSRTSRQIQQI